MASSPPSTLARPGTGWARVNWDVWLVDCAWCPSALTMGPPVPDAMGRIRPGLEWGQAEMICWDCGRLTAPIAWPADPGAVMALLGLRPQVITRNWDPGETLDDLLAENAAHDILPPMDALPGSKPAVMLTVDGFVVGGALLDLLPDADARRALGAVHGIAIGGR